MASPVWLITGSSGGLGYSLTLHVLAAGHRVVATVRSSSKSAAVVKEIEARGGKIVELDIAKPDTISAAAKQAESFYGHIDILVNNAAYSLLGAVEDMTDDEGALQFETNFFGPVRLTRALLPSMRARRTGTIVNISSIAGQDGRPSCGMYAASKFALEGLSETLAHELAPFNIAVLVVEPGAFRTNFLQAAQITKAGVSEPYKEGPVQIALDKFDAANGNQIGDPAKGVARIFEVVTGEGLAGGLKGKILRLPLGSDCVARLEQKLESVTGDLKLAREASLSTDFA
ncbi:hypothetical protein UA08_04203 [Talaromyces atroroseus]|uniref:Ketoreductase domain-containing protein n=1 Tax=Talaromyces atroroseus TaxID=1441469 RepID=A0A1Q5Q8R8_TALAT|nr:hypothetical protein UA08_04203 [Talaromyces atroroseus]OKL60526.1 hypothetical protein UA08_04203 [Talaromyces atroroseus]